MLCLILLELRPQIDRWLKLYAIDVRGATINRQLYAIHVFT